MRREPWAEVDHSVLPGIHLDALQKKVVTSLHRADRRHDSLGVYVDPHKSLYEAGAVLLQFTEATRRRIDRGRTAVQGFLLGFKSCPAGIHAWYSELQVDKLLT